jgi:hypothetical protein
MYETLPHTLDKTPTHVRHQTQLQQK